MERSWLSSTKKKKKKGEAQKHNGMTIYLNNYKIIH